MTVLERGTIFKVDYKAWLTRKARPRHSQGLEEAIYLDGRFGIVLVRLETASWIHMYRCIIGSHDIGLGRAWIKTQEELGLPVSCQNDFGLS